jgi:hypothetical protein
MNTTDKLADALRAMIDPIPYLERTLPEGYDLNVVEAMRQINTREFYVNLAKEALAAYEAWVKPAPTGPVMLVDDLTPHEFALRELYEFQQATGCDTAAEFVAAAPAAPAGKAQPLNIDIDRGRVWIKRGNQSFMMAYEGDEDELQWYCDRLKEALSGIAPDVKTAGELDTHECSECCGKGWNWEPRQVADRISDVQEFKIDCGACLGRGFVGPDAERRAAIESTPAHVDPCVVLWQAMNEAQKYGQRTDDKLIVKFLREAGYVIAPAAPAVPNPGSPEASGMIDSVLAEYNWPSNTKNAARAGYVAATRLMAAPAAITNAAQPVHPDERADLAERIGAAHEASLDDDHRACQSILKECLKMLAFPKAAPMTGPKVAFWVYEWLHPTDGSVTLRSLRPEDHCRKPDRAIPVPLMDEWAQWAQAAPAAPAPAPAPLTLRWEGAKGETFKEMRANLSPELYSHGDTVLIWANEGDLVSLNIRAAIAAASKGGAA